MALLRQCLEEIRALQLGRAAIAADTSIPTSASRMAIARPHLLLQEHRAVYASTISDKLDRNQQALPSAGTSYFSDRLMS